MYGPYLSYLHGESTSASSNNSLWGCCTLSGGCYIAGSEKDFSSKCCTVNRWLPTFPKLSSDMTTANSQICSDGSVFFLKSWMCWLCPFLTFKTSSLKEIFPYNSKPQISDFNIQILLEYELHRNTGFSSVIAEERREILILPSLLWHRI